jgi:hypothetical protein
MLMLMLILNGDGDEPSLLLIDWVRVRRRGGSLIRIRDMIG